MILTHEELHSVIGPANSIDTSRAIEQAVIAKLSQGVEMPKPAFTKTVFITRSNRFASPEIDYYTADQLRTVVAAARLKALEEAEQKCIEIGKRRASNSPFDCADAIRALKGTTP